MKTMHNQKIAMILTASADIKNQIAADELLLNVISQVSDVILNCFNQGGRVYFCGNGGSAADAQHLAAEFSGRFYIDRPFLPAEALHTNSSYITAVANDYGYDEVYARIAASFSKNDLLIGLSTSGNSTNIVRAFEVCQKKGVKTIGLTGAGGGKMKNLSDFWIGVPSNDTPRIQEAHITLGHIICQLVEEHLF